MTRKVITDCQLLAKKASRKMSRNLLGNHVPIAPLVLTLKFKVAVIVVINNASIRKGHKHYFTQTTVRMHAIAPSIFIRPTGIFAAVFIATNFSSVSHFNPFAKL
jgi:hypothetical protein